nr:adenosylcobinamide-phosphate synthase CbiB [Oleomonas cavernae]
MGRPGLEAAFGYPQRLIPLIGHPVIWIGALISRLDRSLNRATMPDSARRLNGVAALGALLALTMLPAWGLQYLILLYLPWGAGIVVLAILASTLIAQRSLDAHVVAVATALETQGLAGGRRAVAMIVGRNTSTLDEAGVARAAIESLGENFSDGIVAPAFWCALLGLPGIVGYKAINTADSMIGHKTARHQAFGWAAARTDDVVNLPASRLSALWLAAAALIAPGADARAALRAAWRDARQHKSPNAGWPEAAMAGALDLALNGPKVYGDTLSSDAWMGTGRPQATARDIRRALALYRRACAIEIGVVAVLAGIGWML